MKPGHRYGTRTQNSSGFNFKDAIKASSNTYEDYRYIQ
jgi:hypothetical protein